LPTNGELVFGRFDPNIGVPPDIDLGYEDHENTVSRRHAKITGIDGYHTIEDLGSRHGVLINGFRPEPGYQLETGDRISLGRAQLIYDRIPTHILIISPDDRVQHTITLTPNGRQFTIAPPNEIYIGRSDTYVDFVPDIDLGGEGKVANRVSRRHAIITWRNRIPYLEDVGSGFGTRLNGEMLLMGQTVQLKPGDHIWLGGCVLAYDVEL
jgi:pSer/pThr/pTyr-binding forkhead associated (FHA) protein